MIVASVASKSIVFPLRINEFDHIDSFIFFPLTPELSEDKVECQLIAHTARKVFKTKAYLLKSPYLHNQ